MPFPQFAHSSYEFFFNHDSTHQFATHLPDRTKAHCMDCGAVYVLEADQAPEYDITDVCQWHHCNEYPGGHTREPDPTGADQAIF